MKKKKKINARFWLCKILNQNYSTHFTSWLTAKVNTTCLSHWHTTCTLKKDAFNKDKLFRVLKYIVDHYYPVPTNIWVYIYRIIYGSSWICHFLTNVNAPLIWMEYTYVLFWIMRQTYRVLPYKYFRNST